MLIAAGAYVMLPTLNQEGLGDLRSVSPRSTPLHLAAGRGHYHVVLVILEAYVSDTPLG